MSMRSVYIEENSATFFLTDFPEFTNPFWNMKRSGVESSNKVDVILSGQETIGSAERETDKEIMRTRFNLLWMVDIEKNFMNYLARENRC